MRTDPMLIPTLLYLLKATAILLLTLGVASLLRRAAAGTRHLVWLAAVVAVVALPLIAAALPDLRVLPIRPWTADAGVAAAGAAGRPDAAGVPNVALREGARPDLIVQTVESPSAADPAEAAAPGWFERLGARAGAVGVVPALLLLWLAGTLVVLGRLAHSAVALRRILATAEPLAGAGWTTPLYEAADRLDLSEAPRLLQSGRVAMPFACGLLRPTIVLPANAGDWSASRRRAVLFHELAHIRRRDLLGHALGRIACALYWMHPLVWAAAYRLRAESERACDDLVLATGTPASEYADHLLQILVGVRANDAPAVALPMGRRREFEGRLLAILDPGLRRHRPTLGHALVLAAFSVTAAALIALAPLDASAASAGVGTAAEPDAGETAIAAADAFAEGPEAAAHGPRVSQPPQPAERQVPAAPAPQPEAGPVPAQDIQAPGHRDALPHGFTGVVEHLATEFGEGIGGLMGSLAASTVQGVLGTSADQEKDVPLLVRLLTSDPSAEVRRTAAWGLYGARDDRATAALIRAATDDESAVVREMAAWALHELSGEPVVAALTAASGDDDPDVRATAVWSLAHAAGPGGSGVGALIARLADADADVRMRAAWGLGSLRPSSAPAPLYQSAIRDEEPEVKVAAAWALTQIADPAARPALTRALREESDPAVIDALAHALVRLGPVDPAALEPLLSSEHAELRARAIRLMAGADAIEPWPWPWPEPRPLP